MKKPIEHPDALRKAVVISFLIVFAGIGGVAAGIYLVPPLFGMSIPQVQAVPAVPEIPAERAVTAEASAPAAAPAAAAPDEAAPPAPEDPDYIQIIAEEPAEIADTTTAADTTTSPAAIALADGFILPFSNTRALTESDLIELTPNELRIARNEIFARHGRRFTDEWLQAHFNDMPWYIPTLPYMVNPEMSSLEHANIEFILAFERGR